MCGIAGIARRDERGVDPETLLRMAAAIKHRGPDGTGIFVGRRVGFAHTRLSIIDHAGGAQPMATADEQLVVTFNGEIFNYRELRAELAARGHRFRSDSDTQVLLHAWERWGEGMLDRLNGQFAFAIFDRRTDTVFLARDRFGVRPLFYAEQPNGLFFASEVKALFATGEVLAQPDPHGLDEVFTLWASRAPRTPFLGIRQLEPGSCALWRGGRLRLRRWYQLRYPEVSVEPRAALDTLEELFSSAVNLRLRADVPVGGYLSGGLDSSLVCSVAAGALPHELRTCSITFSDSRFDESGFQRMVGKQVGSMHEVVHVDAAAVGAVFPDVIRHAETPLLRTAPAPMYLLARLAKQQGLSVVLTGEGSDELFLGYDLFRETAVRLFCLRQPESRMRPRLFDRLYPWLEGPARGGDFWRRFFLEGADRSDPLFSHIPRFKLATRIKDFYSSDMRMSLAGADPLGELRQSLPDDFGSWSPLNQAAYLEMTTLLSSYLLSSQGDRMAMAHAVEGRYPFLDYRVFEFASALPVSSKLRGLTEKEILRRFAAPRVPPAVLARTKQPYRAPDIPAFFGPGAPEYVRALLAPDAIRSTGMFDAQTVAGLVRRCESGRATGASESQALVAVLSTQLWHQAFMADSRGVAVPQGADLVLREREVVAA
jgi:asparagine synthase (glutamine-hydrolysing)